MTFSLLIASLLAFSSIEGPTPPPEALALSDLELVGAIERSGWASTIPRGDVQTELQAPGLLQSLEFGERNDHPCYVKATFLLPTGGTATRTANECGSNGPTDRSLRTIGEMSSTSEPFGTSQIKIAKASTAMLTHTVRIKGVRLYQTNLLFRSDGTATFGYESVRPEFRRTNSENFSYSDDQTAKCSVTSNGAPRVAVGLGLSFEDGDLINVWLLCQEVRRAAPDAPTRSGTRDLTPIGSDTPTSTTYTPTGAFTTTSISGSPGTDLEVITSGRNFVLYGMEFGERSDEPCYLKTYWWNAANGRADVRTRVETLDLCNGNVGSREYIGPAPSEIEATSGPLRGVHKIAVCTNGRSGNNLKLKGARVYAWQATGEQVGEHTTTPSFARSNCSDWEPAPVNCGTARLAVGLEVHRNTISGRGSITGLALRCKTIEVE